MKFNCYIQKKHGGWQSCCAEYQNAAPIWFDSQAGAVRAQESQIVYLVQVAPRLIRGHREFYEVRWSFLKRWWWNFKSLVRWVDKYKLYLPDDMESVVHKTIGQEQEAQARARAQGGGTDSQPSQTIH